MSPSGYRIKKEFHQESKPHFFKCYQSQAMIKTSPLPFTPWPAPSRPCRRPRKHRLTSLEIGRQLGLLFACAQEETRKLSPKGEARWTYPPVVICLYTPIFTWRKSWFSGSLLDMIFSLGPFSGHYSHGDFMSDQFEGVVFRGSILGENPWSLTWRGVEWSKI